MMSNEEIGKALQALRKAAGLTQKQLAKRLGIAASQVSRYECGLQAIRFAMHREWERICKEAGEGKGNHAS